MKELEEKIVNFAKERDWLQFNTPENLAKSISIEAKEIRLEKLEISSKKYPIEKSKGISTKYNKL